jgi:hypothetical protein
MGDPGLQRGFTEDWKPWDSQAAFLLHSAPASLVTPCPSHPATFAGGDHGRILSRFLMLSPWCGRGEKVTPEVTLDRRAIVAHYRINADVFGRDRRSAAFRHGISCIYDKVQQNGLELHLLDMPSQSSESRLSRNLIDLPPACMSRSSNARISVCMSDICGHRTCLREKASRPRRR